MATFAGNNLEWLWTALLVPLFGWLWQRRKASKGGPNAPANG